LAKRDQATDEFCTKIRDSVRDELGVNITLSQAALNALHTKYNNKLVFVRIALFNIYLCHILTCCSSNTF